MSNFGGMANILFLDIDGVLNCQEHYESERFIKYRDSQPQADLSYKEVKKQLRKQVKKGLIERMDYYAHQLCDRRVRMLNWLCKEADFKVVISSTWRHGKEVSDLQAILNHVGATFEVIDKTPDLALQTESGLWIATVRGNEIKQWWDANMERFDNYAIIDDDSDMLLEQKDHFYQTNAYSGLTHELCESIMAVTRPAHNLNKQP